ncbi:hypothetical protein Hypma_002261 [Hypsizygus marmoreus]|uniref:Uncharacterized protein n=1 Tax=Hypsizygus marmoreus TaxID=39966 RepID=A0A369K241_HYPMA|nr:hypothetical protein Hypma_002261 [Hypsizygus marmoreus]
MPNIAVFRELENRKQPLRRVNLECLRDGVNQYCPLSFPQPAHGRFPPVNHGRLNNAAVPPGAMIYAVPTAPESHLAALQFNALSENNAPVPQDNFEDDDIEFVLVNGYA